MNRLARWLLETFLAPDVSDALIGDLTEQLAAGRGRTWLWREVFVALWRLGSYSLEDPMTGFIADLRHAARLLRRAPGFALVSILTLGLGIGATTAIVSVVRPVLLEPLPYPAAGRLAFVWQRDRQGGRRNVSFVTFRDLVDQSRTIVRAAVLDSWTPMLSDHGMPEHVAGDRVSYDYFRTLGVRPAIGRDFLPEEDKPGHAPAVILSYGLWQRRFGGDPDIVGQSIGVNGNQISVVGVMPASFENVASPAAELWRVLGYGLDSPGACRQCGHLRMVARMRDGVAADALSADLTTTFARLRLDYPADYRGSEGIAVVGMLYEATRAYRPALLALGGAVVLVLLIAMANVANLQLARAVRRRGEFAVRAALGAGRERLLRQLLTEGLLLGALGGLAGLIVATIGIPMLVAHLPPELPRLGAVRLDGVALAAIGAMVLGFAVVVGLAPARRNRGDLLGLRSAARLAGGTHQTTRAALVVGEVALASTLLVGAGLLAQSLVRLLAVDVGFEPSHLLTMQVSAVGPAYTSNDRVFSYHDRIRDAARSVPGVVSVAVANQLQLGGTGDREAYGVRTQRSTSADGDRYTVSAGYFATMRIPIVRGRSFAAEDEADSTHYVAIVSASMAASLWPGEDPIGQRVQVGALNAPFRTVVGVAGDVHGRALDASFGRQWYVPERQWAFADNEETLIVRTTADPAALASLVRDAVHRVDATQAVARLATMDRVVVSSTMQRRLAFALFGSFALVALLLAVTGIYGVLATTVAERSREIGLRVALGATPGHILASVVGRGLRLVTIGAVIGLAGAAGLTRLLHTLLFGIGPGDPATLAGVIALLLGVALAACVVPARRALGVDPATALRAE